MLSANFGTALTLRSFVMTVVLIVSFTVPAAEAGPIHRRNFLSVDRRIFGDRGLILSSNQSTQSYCDNYKPDKTDDA